MTTSSFTPTARRDIPSLGVEIAAFEHAATGARHFHISSEDTNNAFMVAFPTLPQDSTGVAHILEHTTLCGSERYPVRDPFFMMLRRSLNTYMNAFTTSDSTAYPFATQNRKDFDNLLGVYLDAVFHPRLDPLDFAQEGWRLEFDGATGLAYHGVVYNEMKGAMSSPIAQLWQHVHSSLFPDTIYRHNSGGDPLAIPDLSYAALKAFHARHYHPSNAVFMTYGSFPCADHQAAIENLALAGFAARERLVDDAPQAPFAEAREVEHVYDVEIEQAQTTHIIWAWACGTTAAVDDFIRAHLLATVLLEHGASPLRHFLETTELAQAPSELMGIDDSARQLAFMCGVEGSEAAHAAALERGILDVLSRVAEEGVDDRVLEAAIDHLEMAQRDIAAEGYPYGLQLMGRMLPASMHGADPLSMLDLDPVLTRVRDELLSEGNAIGDWVRVLLLDNPHRVRIIMRPDAGKAARDQALEQDRLEALRATMSAAEAEALRTANADLEARQASVDDASVLPCVRLSDVPAVRPLLVAKRTTAKPVPVQTFECGTNGIFRARMAYRLPLLDAKSLALLPLFCDFLTELGTGRDDYLTAVERRAALGSFSAYALVRPGPAPADPIRAWLVVNAKGLARKGQLLTETMLSLLGDARFDERERIAELVAQARAEAEQSLTDRGHRLAVLAAARRFGPTAALDEIWDGAHAVRILKHLGDAAGGDDLDALGERFAQIRAAISSAPFELALIGEDAALGAAESLLDGLSTAARQTAPFEIALEDMAPNDGWLIASQVNFCAQAYAAVHETDRDAAPLMVLGRYLQDGYLHREIREKGGAYGSGAGYDADSQTFRFFSYRDPRCLETFEDFRHALEWFATDRDPQRLEESILGVIRTLDTARSPAGEADRAFLCHLSGRDDLSRRRFREAVLNASHDALREACERHLQSEQCHRAAVAGYEQDGMLRAAGLVPARL